MVLRPFNTYGPRQSARAVIPTILAQLLSGRTRIRLGSLSPRRDLTYMSDTIAGFLAAGLCPGLEGETIHLGTGRSESIEEVFRAACTVCGVQATVEEDAARVRPRQSEVMVLQSDPGRARQRLGWEAKIPLQQGLAQTAEWIRANLDRYRPDAYAV